MSKHEIHQRIVEIQEVISTNQFSSISKPQESPHTNTPPYPQIKWGQEIVKISHFYFLSKNQNNYKIHDHCN